MPDWSYQTILRPAFRSLSPGLRTKLCKALDRFGRSAIASPLVSFFGDMDPGTGLQVQLGRRILPGPVGIGSRLPGGGDLVSLVSRFGVGFVELGPVGCTAGTTQDGRRLLSIAETQARLARKRSQSCPVALRLEPCADQDVMEAGIGLEGVIVSLAPHATFFVAALPAAGRTDGWDDEARRTLLAKLAVAARRVDVPLFIQVSEGGVAGEQEIAKVRAAGADGAWLVGAATRDVVTARRQWPEAILGVAEGVIEPADAWAALEAGADLVAVDEGLLQSGPGLPKRIHEVVRYARQAKSAPPRWGSHTLREPWVGMAAMALVLMGAGLVAWALGVTVVLLDYDERFLDLDRAALHALNPRLLDFLAHDRVSFAAATLALAFLYLQVACHAYARNERWARRTLVVAGLAGFASFFLFLGFGYLDPLHLVVWLAALAGFLWGIRRVDAAPPWIHAPDLRNDAAWQRSQWGQLGFVGLGVGLVSAGIAVCSVAVVGVFVSTDLGFLGADREELDAANGQLLSLVAHDRAGFGGGLVATGLAVLLLSLWGMRRGAAWVWWTLLGSGVIGFLGILWIHAHVGYTSFLHLAPAYLALAVFVASAALCRGFLVGRDARTRGGA